MQDRNPEHERGAAEGRLASQAHHRRHRVSRIRPPPPFGETKETPILLPPDVLLRNKGRTLDPATGTQPGSARRTRENRPDPNVDPAR